MKKFDVIVIGGGHAGCEAAHAAARANVSVALVTMKHDSIGQMSCNPAVGGIGKSHLAKEVDALDGLICKIADYSALQRRKLNASKGPAVQATRIQTCRDTYKLKMQQAIDAQTNLSVIEGMVSNIIVDNETLQGVVMSNGVKIFAKTVVLTTGTFLGGKIHVGNKSFSAGRLGDNASNELENFFKKYGFSLGRLKTGTPPRILKSSIDYSMPIIYA
jgi:tRNA uridine 5-carboxymethylaminomethyl modification enzyme